MKASGKRLIISTVILFCGAALVSTVQTQAKELSMPPHLIQTVSGQDIYEGMLALDLFTCPVLEEADPEAAYENVKNCVVRLDMGTAYGSGVIFRMTEDAVIIATNRHVLEYWDESSGWCGSRRDILWTLWRLAVHLRAMWDFCGWITASWDTMC